MTEAERALLMAMATILQNSYGHLEELVAAVTAEQADAPADAPPDTGEGSQVGG